MVKNLPVMWETQIPFLGREDPLEKGMATHLVFLPGEFHGPRSLLGTESWTRQSDSFFFFFFFSF